MRDLPLRVRCGLLLTLLLSSCAATRIESLVGLQAFAQAHYHDGWRDQAQVAREVDVRALTPWLARATWVDQRVITKGGFSLAFPDGRRLRVAVGFELFMVDGVPGHFEIRPEDRAAYRAAVDAVRRLPAGETSLR